MIDRIINFPARLSFFLFGARQTGKSTVINQRFKEHVWEVNLLQNEVYLLYLKEPHLFRIEAERKILQEGVETIFLDEVQRIPPLLNEIQTLMFNYPRCRFIITGSSARKLKRGRANLLAGRAVEQFLFPLITDEMAPRFELEETLLFGSLPSVFGREEGEKRALLKTYIHTYLQEEIKSEALSRNISGFSRFLDIAAAQFGEQVNFSSIARDSSLSVHTIQSYYEILEDTLIGLRLMPWRKSVRKRLSLQPKFYLFDLGVTNALLRRLEASPDPLLKGRLFEQFILLEIHRRLSYKGSEASLFFWRTSNGSEVDLLIERHGKIQAAIEIKLTPRVSSTHLSGLRSFRREHTNTPLFLVSTTPNAYTLDGVNVIPWQEFLSRELPSLL